MTGFVSKRQAAQGKLDGDTQVYAGRKRGSIALARQLCYEIAGATSEDDDISGRDYGSVDVAEILSAEVVRLQAALAQPEQQAEPVQEQKYEKRIAPYSTTLSMLLNTAPPQCPWVGLTEWEREAIAHACGALGAEWLVFIEAVEKALKEKNR